MNGSIPFSGSYAAEDVQFLLTPMAVENTPIDAKEALIQSGIKHYSELLTHESLPTDDYLALFHRAMDMNKQRMAAHLLLLAEHMAVGRPDGIVLVSLARAGTPIGVVLKHLLKRRFGIDAAHYSVSIIRDFGLDLNALRYILNRHAPQQLAFVDGWTGKGVIARQLAASLRDFAASDGIEIAPDLFVLADLSGDATVAASAEDYLIPSCILNATVSGLVSRSVRQDRGDQTSNFHGCYYYEQFKGHDLSRHFVGEILGGIDQLRLDCGQRPQSEADFNRKQLKRQSLQFIDWVGRRYGIDNDHYIKPGIGEATRVLLRRSPGRLLVQNRHAEATRHLLWLARSKEVPIDVINDLPYRAAALIKAMKPSF